MLARMAGGEVQLVDLVKRFSDVTAVAGINLDMPPGEFFSLLGPSGCGKTTTLRLIAGFERPDEGQILLDGVDMAQTPPHKRNVNTVFQNYALFPHLTVADNVAFGLKYKRVTKQERQRTVGEALALVQLGGFESRRPGQLSGGQQQRVALARALSVRPRLLLLDEPLSNLDANLRVLMREEIKRLQRELRLTVAYVTHDQEEAMSISDRIAVMRAGRIEQIGTPAHIYERPATEFVAGFVGTATFLDGEVARADADGCVLRTAFGVMALRGFRAGLAPGARVKLVVRPEAVRFSPVDSPDGTAALAGKIVGLSYTGAVARYWVEVSGTRLAVDLHDPGHSSQYTEGDRVSVQLPPDPPVLAVESAG